MNVNTDRYQSTSNVSLLNSEWGFHSKICGGPKGHQTEPHIHRGKKRKFIKFFLMVIMAYSIACEHVHCTHDGAVQDGRPYSG